MGVSVPRVAGGGVMGNRLVVLMTPPPSYDEATSPATLGRQSVECRLAWRDKSYRHGQSA